MSSLAIDAALPLFNVEDKVDQVWARVLTMDEMRFPQMKKVMCAGLNLSHSNAGL